MDLSPSRFIALSAFLVVACGDGRTESEGGNGLTAGEGTDDDGVGEDGDEGQLFDAGEGQDDGADDGGGGCGDDGELEFSYIWVSNSGESTISKIDTRAIIEEGRYQVRPDGSGDPSRTSVNLSGDVAVASRMGGLTKVYARIEDCLDQNGAPGIQSSTGKDDVLSWGEEECVAWHSDLGYAAQRPVAWTAGEFDQHSCQYYGAKVWTAGNRDPWGAKEVWFSRVNGDDGSLDVDVKVPELMYYALGPYGGAADGDGNFWFTGMAGPDIGYNALIRVDGESTDYAIYEFPEGTTAYGITVDHEGRPWTAGGGITRFNPETETFDYTLEYGGAGLMEDAEDRMWIAHVGDSSIGSVIALDVESMDFVKGLVATHGAAGTPMFAGKGVSVDFDGYVWQISKTLTKGAHRFDPETGSYETYEGLNQPYTYSDMTGWGLKNAAGPPPQG
jgi:streptogramin lyase